MGIARRPAGTSAGGQFAPTGREEIALQGVETLEQARARLCPPYVKGRAWGDTRGAYYDENMTSEELEAKLRSAYEEAQSSGLIDSDVDITIETHEGEVSITVVHPDSHTDTMMDTCTRIKNAYALTYLNLYGEWAGKNSASIFFNHPSPPHVGET